MAMPRLRIRYADVAATLALLMACGGTAYAAGVLPRHSVGTPQLKSAAVTTAKLHKASVTSAKLANGSVTLTDLAGADVTGSVSFSLSANECKNLSLAVSGAKKGQVAMLAWTGSSNPSVVMAGPGRVAADNSVMIPMCNFSGTSVNLPSTPVRVITFD
jgi:hypothetical protein